MEGAFQKDIPQIIKEIKAARRRKKTKTAIAYQLREFELNKRQGKEGSITPNVHSLDGFACNQGLEERAKELGRTTQAERKSRWEIEESRRLGRVIHSLTQKTKEEIRLVTITQNGITKECNSRQSTEEALIIEGTRRFSQTEKEPPIQPYITHLVGFWGQKEASRQILEGVFDSSVIKDSYLK